MRLGRGEKKFDMGWRFFKGFKKCIKGGEGEHMDFINDINPELT